LQKCSVPGTVDIIEGETSKSQVMPASQVPAVLIESRQPPTVSSSVESQLPDNRKGVIASEDSKSIKSIKAKKVRIANIDIFANNNLLLAMNTAAVTTTEIAAATENTAAVTTTEIAAATENTAAVTTEIAAATENTAEEDDSDTDTIDDALNSVRINLFNKGKKLREIL